MYETYTEQAVIESRQSRGGGEGTRLHTGVSQYKDLQLQAGRVISASRDIAENENSTWISVSTLNFECGQLRLHLQLHSDQYNSHQFDGVS